MMIRRPLARTVAALCLTLSPGALAAWEFTPAPVCTLRHATEAAEVTVTHDPRRAEPYAIAVTLQAGEWQGAPVFAILFEGSRPLTISTDRHVLSDGGATLTVTDRGFGNVLSGLAANITATAVLGPDAVAVPLTGPAPAAPAVAAFEACLEAPLA